MRGRGVSSAWSRGSCGLTTRLLLLAAAVRVAAVAVAAPLALEGGGQQIDVEAPRKMMIRTAR